MCFCDLRNPISPFLEVTNLEGSKVVCVVRHLHKGLEGAFFLVTFLDYSSLLESGQKTQSLLLPGAPPKG